MNVGDGQSTEGETENDLVLVRLAAGAFNIDVGLVTTTCRNPPAERGWPLAFKENIKQTFPATRTPCRKE
jgi:hypothetical protein